MLGTTAASLGFTKKPHEGSTCSHTIPRINHARSPGFQPPRVSFDCPTLRVSATGIYLSGGGGNMSAFVPSLLMDRLAEAKDTRTLSLG